MSRTLKVLVVDDDRQMVKTICDILQLMGYDPRNAYSGEEAIDKVKNDSPDFVLMDLKMPGINGVEALKIIKGISPGTQVVLMTAYATDEQAKEAKLHGATVLIKPVDFQQILAFLALLKNEMSILMTNGKQLDSGEV